MKFILDKKKWICGEPKQNTARANFLGIGKTALLNEQGFQCCLGQFCEQLGVDKKIMLGNAEVSDLMIDLKPFVDIDDDFNEDQSWRYRDNDFTASAYSINDDEYTSVETKIKLLTELCIRHGHELEVIN